MRALNMRKRMMFVALAVGCMAVVMAPPVMGQTQAPKPLTPQQQKLRDCGAEWQKLKQEGKTAGVTWASVRRECLRRK
jgi:hypothetical protein